MFYLVITVKNYKSIVIKEKQLSDFEREKELNFIKASNEAEERRSKKLASDLHDQISSLVCHIGLNIDLLIEKEQNNRELIKKLEIQRKAVGQVIAGINSISNDLIPATLIEFGLIETIESVVNLISNKNKLKANFQNKIPANIILTFTEFNELTIYRIVLELLNNLYKHANYEFLRVTINASKSDLTIHIIHNGTKVSNSDMERYREQSKGLGLKSLQRRVLALSATIDYFTMDDLANIKLIIPFNK